MSNWQTKSSKVVYKNPWIVVHEDEVIMPNGKDGIYGYIDATSESVYIAAVDDEGYTYVVGQKRYTTKEFGWECIAGKMDGDDIETAVRRELMEEAGVTARAVTVLTPVQIANGISTITGYICLATGIEKVSDELDEEEGITEVRRLSFDEIRSMILTGTMKDTESIATFLTAITHLEQTAK